MMDRVRLLERRDIDELIILDIAATPNNRGPRFDEVKSLCENLFCPVTIGGGVRNVEDMVRLLASGADKVSINTVILADPKLIDAAAKKCGAQAVVASVDVFRGYVRSECGRTEAWRHPVDWAKEVESRGAGEILLTSIDRDGTLAGYDVELVRNVAAAVSIPVIACGGAGTYEHFEEVLRETKAHAVAAGAMFQFCDATPKGAARYLHDHGVAVRL